jgi:hypothetical protein
MFIDRYKVSLPGGHASAEEVDGVIYLAAGVRNAGAGIAILHSWYPMAGQHRADEPPAPLDQFRRLGRDLYIAAHDIGFWQGAIRDPDDPHREEISKAIVARDVITIDLLYGDHEGGQRTVTRLSLTPFDTGVWMTSVGRYWHIDGNEPR